MQQQLKFRRKFTAAFLGLISLLIPGIGHLFGGKLKRAFILSGLFITFFILINISGILRFASAAVTGYITGILFLLYIGFDAYKINSNKKGISLRWYNKFYFYIFFIVVFYFIRAIPNLPNMGNYRTYYIPNDNNVPTLQVGDIVMTKKFNQSNSSTKTGDFVVFTIPENLTNPSKHYIKRVVAQIGDSIFIKNGITYLNNKQVNEPYILPSNISNSESLNFQVDNPIVVPKDNVFVLGDNRDNSYDSRYFGYVPNKNIKNIALYILFSTDLHKIGMRLD